MRSIAADQANAIVLTWHECALLDVREAGPFSEGHPLFAIPAPYSRLEMLVPQLVPRRAATVILIDAGDGTADRAAAVLEALGYADVRVVEGGTEGWRRAGLTLYKGVNVPSKTLGELAEHVARPPTITADVLAAWRREGRRFRLFDVRPADEHRKMRVPGSRCVPNGELAHRFDAAAAADEPVVVTCAGRTRGLVGALGLRFAGVPTPVFALENGTQGWVLAGGSLERGADPDPLPPLTDRQRAATRARADALIARERIDLADVRDVRRMRGEPRTTYLFDVRSAEEAAADPLPAFTHALSGQLVQATDAWVAVRGARIVLADDLGLRAAIAAVWLRALGYEPVVVRVDDAVRALPASPVAPIPAVPEVEATAALADGGSIVDLRPSAAYRRAHVRGAVWSVRPRLHRLDLVGPAFVIADDPSGALGVAELLAAGVDAALVAGGHAAMVAAGAPVTSDADSPSAMEAGDVTTFAAGRHEGDLAASRLYLEWETGLVGQLTDAERAAFRLPASLTAPATVTP